MALHFPSPIQRTKEKMIEFFGVYAFRLTIKMEKWVISHAYFYKD